MADKQIVIQKTIYGLNSFNNIINTNFNQLARPISPITDSPDKNINDFFEDYSDLFYDIPPSGSENSHYGLASRSLEYLGVSLEDLQNEIDYLRQENIELKNQVLQISNVNIGDLETI